MIILGIDTSSDYAVLTLAGENGQCYESVAERHERQLSSRLYGMLDALLERRGISFEQIDAFAVGLGPGSFTGVRVAVTTMRTLAQVTGKPLIGIPTLDIFIAGARRGDSENSEAVAALLPSRRNEVYARIEPTGSALSGSSAFAASYAEALEIVRAMPRGSLVTGPTLLLETLFGGEVARDVQLAPQDAPGAAAFAELIGKAIRSGQTQDPLSLDPMYVVPPAVSQHKTASTGP